MLGLRVPDEQQSKGPPGRPDPLAEFKQEFGQSNRLKLVHEDDSGRRDLWFACARLLSVEPLPSLARTLTCGCDPPASARRTQEGRPFAPADPGERLGQGL